MSLLDCRSLLKFNRIILDPDPAPEALAPWQLSATYKLVKTMLFCRVLGAGEYWTNQAEDKALWDP